MTARASAQSTSVSPAPCAIRATPVLPGVTVTAVQTETGLVRSVVSDESGGYVLASLPVWPYRLEFSLTGFRTAVQTGIVLQVNTNPTIDATLPLGDLTETTQVAAGAPLIDTRSPGIGMVVDNERVEELPLNGRLTLDLVYLTGLAAPSGTLSGARGGAAGPGSPGTIAVAGGLPNGTEYLLDGSNHNDPYNNGAMPFPFPEALQEFKVETSALTAQYGYHSAAVVNAVTRSGTNTIHGSAFEFLRDDSMNARDPFAPIGPDGQRRSDGLNRNQFGGSLRGPVVRDRLFYFGAYQRTRVRRIPTSSFPLIGAGGGKVERPRGVVGRQRERGTGVRSVERGRNRIAAGHRDPRLIPPQRHVRDGRRIAPRRHLRLTGELLQVRQVVEPPVRDAQRLAAVPPGNEDEPDARRDVPEVVVRQRFSRHRLVAGEDESRRRVGRPCSSTRG